MILKYFLTLAMLFSLLSLKKLSENKVFNGKIAMLGNPVSSFPDSSNTGCTGGISLITTRGRTVTDNNTIIKNQKITGALIIKAKNVVVRNCWIVSYFAKGEKANGTGVIEIMPHAGATIEHCTLDGQLGTHAAIWDEGESVNIRYNNCFNVDDGIFVWDADNFTIEENYIHNLTAETSNGHIDGFQTEGGSHGVIRHNTFDIYQNQNACVSIWNSRRNSDDILVENNFMAGSGFACYAEDYDPSEANPAGGYSVTNIRFINNVFSTKYYSCVGRWGVWYTRGQPTDGWKRSGNYILETGENVDTSNPHYNGQLCY